MHELFETKSLGKGIWSTAKWIMAARNLIRREDFDTYEAYTGAVAELCAEWEQHYHANSALYENSDIFYSALILSAYSDVYSCGIDCRSHYGTFTHLLPLTDAEGIDAFPFERKSIIAQMRETFSGRLQEQKECFSPNNATSYKMLLDDMIKRRFYDWEIAVTPYSENGRIDANTLEEFLALCGNRYKIDSSNIFVKKRSYIEGIEKWGISKTLYNDFCSFSNSEKDFDRKFFINMAFMLGLSYPHAETLLNYNGYSMERSERVFDKICRTALKCGFSREMTIALIEKYNQDHSNPVPNLTKNRK